MSEDNFNVTNEPQEGGKGLAIASMILGIVSIVLSCNTYICIGSAILAIVFGVMYNKKNEKSKMATAGIICSIVGLVLLVIWIVASAAIIAALGLSLSDFAL